MLSCAISQDFFCGDSNLFSIKLSLILIRQKLRMGKVLSDKINKSGS